MKTNIDTRFFLLLNNKKTNFQAGSIHNPIFVPSFKFDKSLKYVTLTYGLKVSTQCKHAFVP